MTLLEVIFWFLALIAILFLVVLITPVYYRLSCCWLDTISGEIVIRAGLIELQLVLEGFRENRRRVKILGLCVLNKIFSQKEKKQYKTGEIKNEQGSLSDVFVMLDKGFLRKLLETIIKIIKTTAPKKFEAKGVLGFDDPYYTGLFAAVKGIIPQIDILPDFTGQIREINVSIEGRIIIVIVLIYGAKLFFSREGRLALKKIRQQKKLGKMQPKHVF